MASIIGRSGHVTCHELDRDRYGRIVAVCEAHGAEINGELVRAGWALEYQQYSDGRYADEAAEARSTERGLWAGAFVPPWDWRSGDRLASERVVSGQPEGCEIKGNISDNGRIFHVPGNQNYGRTHIDESNGERWFCSASEAEAAGWRGARG